MDADGHNRNSIGISVTEECGETSVVGLVPMPVTKEEPAPKEEPAMQVPTFTFTDQDDDPDVGKAFKAPKPGRNRRPSQVR